MTDFAPPQMPPRSNAADRAVAYLLRRLKDDPRLAYYFPMTQSLRLLTAAYAEATNQDAAAFHDQFERGLKTEAPCCPSGDCALKRAIRLLDGREWDEMT